MNNIEAYMDSGILELYVLGALSLKDRLEVETVAAKYPVIKSELDEIQQLMEYFAIANAVKPTAASRNRILNSLS